MENELPTISITLSDRWKDYELIDSGNGTKLERFGKYTFARPEAQAVWQKHLPATRWEKADAVFQTTGEENGGHWNFRTRLPERWQMDYYGLKCWVQPAASRHLGVFPEQANGWDWMMEKIKSAGKPLKVLNLFGYTGMASLAAAAAGAQVTHVDASKKAITSARENQAISGLEGKPIRWMVDDALKFTQREARRGSLYDGIILDPPKFGRGPKGEVWEFFDLLPDLLSACRNAMTPQPSFLMLTAYAVKSSALTLHGAVAEMMRGLPGELTIGELATRESSAGRIVSNSIYAKWSGKA
jgi:23S rRNA (cytosine1962-C5)-methyltransferase